MSLTYNTGVGSYTGIAAEVTYGTAVAATSMINLISNGLTRDQVNNQSTALVGTSSRGKSRRGAQVVSGPVVLQWTYDYSEEWLTQFAGTRTAAVSPLLDTYSFDTDVTDSVTIASNLRASVVHEYDGLRTNVATLVGNPADGLRWTLDMLGGVRTITGTTNTAGGLQGLSIPAADILYEEMTFRIGDLGDALAAADDFCPETFTLAINRNLVHSIVNKREPEEAKPNGFMDVTLTFTLPRVDTDQFITWMEAGTLVQASFNFTDGTNIKEIRLPVGRVTSAPQTLDGPELQPTEIEVMFEHNLADDNTQTGFTFEPAIEMYEDDQS